MERKTSNRSSQPSDIISNQAHSKENHMTNKANIFYDHEIEELIRGRAVSVLPLVEYVFDQYPSASLKDIFYTVEVHIQSYGIDSYPESLLRAPQIEAELEITPQEQEIEEPEVEFEEVVEEPSFGSDEPPVIRRGDDRNRNIRRRKVDAPREKLNVRGIMDDINELGL